MSIPIPDTGTIEVQLRVRYAETDQMGVAYHSNYLIWFEAARTSYCRSCGVTYADLERHSNLFLPVVEVRCRYRVPLRYDDVFKVRCWIEASRSRALTFRYQILCSKGRTLLADGLTRHVVTDSDGQPRRISPEVRALLQSPKRDAVETPV